MSENFSIICKSFPQRFFMDYTKWFAERLSQLRMEKGVSARDMSLSLGQSASYINKYRKQAFPALYERILLYMRVSGNRTQRFFWYGHEITQKKYGAYRRYFQAAGRESGACADDNKRPGRAVRDIIRNTGSRRTQRWGPFPGGAAHIAPHTLIYIKHESMGSGVFVHKYRRAGLRSGRIHHR